MCSVNSLDTHAFINRKKRIILLRHHGIWLIVLLLYVQLVHTSMSILECPSLPSYEFPVSDQNTYMLCITSLIPRLPDHFTCIEMIGKPGDKTYVLPLYNIQQSCSCLKLQRWFVNGNVRCFSGWHIPLALLAIAVLMVTVFFVPLTGIISMKCRLIKVRY